MTLLSDVFNINDHTQGTDTALGAQSENLNMNTHKVVGVVDPTSNQEAATKKYVDDNIGGGSSKWTDGGTHTYCTAEGGNSRIHDSGLLSLEATGGTAHPLIASNKWGYSSSFTETGDRLLVLDTGNHTSSPAVWIEKDYISNSTPTGDPTVPVGMYVGHEHTGSGVGFTHSIMGYALNNGTGNNDVVGVSGRARKKGAGIGDACGVWGSAYNDVNQNGGVMGLEGCIYNNNSTQAATDSLGSDQWTVGLHIMAHSDGANAAEATAGIAVNGAGDHRFWNAILIDSNAFPGAGTVGTVGINMGGCNNTRKPQYGIKFGKAHAHIRCTDSLSMESAKSFFSYINGTENFVWRKGTYASSSDLMILSDNGSLTAKQIKAEPASGTAFIYSSGVAAGNEGRFVCQSGGTDRARFFANNSASYMDYTGSLSFRTIAGANKVIFDANGNITADGTITANSWTLDKAALKDKWKLIDSIRDAYKKHSGKNLHPALQAITVVEQEDGTKKTRYGKRLDDFVQVAIECIAELKDRIAVLENKK